MSEDKGLSLDEAQTSSITRVTVGYPLRVRAWRTARQLYESPTVWAVVWMALSNVFGIVVHAIAAIVQAAFVVPKDLGEFRSYAIVTGYLYLLQLGTFDALHRRFPVLVGRSQRPLAIASAEVVRSWSLFVCLIVGMCFSIAALGRVAAGDSRGAMSWCAQIATYFGAVYGNCLGILLLTNHRFRSYSKSTLVTSITSLLSLPLFPLFSYVALCFRTTIIGVTQALYRHLVQPLKLQWRFTWRELKSLVREGIPIFSASYIQSVGWTAVEGTLIFRFCGPEALGLWSMSQMVIEAARQIPLGGTTVYVPRIEEHYGRTGSARACWLLVRRPILFNLAAALALAVVASITLPSVIELLMPKYVAAVPCMQLMLLYLPLAALELPYYILRGMGRVGAQNVAAFLGFTVFVVMSLVTTCLGLGLAGIIGASVVGKYFWLACVYIFVHRSSNGASSSVQSEEKQRECEQGDLSIARH